MAARVTSSIASTGTAASTWRRVSRVASATAARPSGEKSSMARGSPATPMSVAIMGLRVAIVSTNASAIRSRGVAARTGESDMTRR